MRHIYFYDHPIEFIRMNTEPTWYVSVDELKDYIRRHPALLAGLSGFDAADQVGLLYSDLSAGVHGRKVDDLEFRTSLAKIEFDSAAAAKNAESLKRCAQLTNFLLALFHRDELNNFGMDDRRIILRSMPKKARLAWVSSA